MKRFRISAALAFIAPMALPAATAAEPALAPGIPVAMVADMTSGRVLFARQADLSFVPASVTKVMTAYSAFELMAQGQLRADQSFGVSQSAYTAWRGQGTSMNLRMGERVPVDALLRGITTASANDAAIVLAEGAAGSVPGWTALMNNDARQLGMTNSNFNTPNGWPDGGKTNVSARDLVTLGTALITRHPEAYQRYFGKKVLTWNGITQYNRDPAIGVVAGADGIKTGYTAEAGYNYLGSAERSGRRLIVVVGGAASEEMRAVAAKELIEWGFAAWGSQPLFAKGARVGEALVQDGDARRVTLRTDRNVMASFPVDGRQHRIALRLIYRGPLQAPVAAGAAVADLEIAVDRLPPSTVPLFAAHAIGKAGPLDRLWNGLMGLFT